MTGHDDSSRSLTWWLYALDKARTTSFALWMVVEPKIYLFRRQT